MTLAEHLERNLGIITKGIKFDDRMYNISVSIFKNQPFAGVTTVCTLGLSEYPLIYQDKTFYMELILGFEDYFDEDTLSKFLLSFSESLIQNGIAPYKGHIYDFSEKIISNSKMSSIYVTTPLFYKEDLQLFRTEEKTVIFPWVIPIYKSESDYIRKNGWNKFEVYLEEQKVNNLWDLTRESYQFA